MISPKHQNSNLNTSTPILENGIRKVFQGKSFSNSMKKLLTKPRMYEELNLNKIILHESMKFIDKKQNNSDERNRYSILNKIFWPLHKLKALLGPLKYVLLNKTILEIKHKGMNNIWFIVSPKIRKSYSNEIEKNIKSNNSPYVISWKKINFRENNIVRFRRMVEFIKLVILCRASEYSFEVALRNAALCMAALDLKRDLPNHSLPSAVLIIKDYLTLENALAQSFNILNVPTFTTQHAVHHCFKGKNFRTGNIDFINRVSKYILCWGDYSFKLFKKFNPNTICILSSANFLPKLSSKRGDYKTAQDTRIVIALGGRQHQAENLCIIKMCRDIEDKTNKTNFLVRLHPTISEEYYTNIIDKMNFHSDVLIHSTLNNNSYDYLINSICITGLTGTYYDFLYLGYKTIYYDYGYELEEDLPRVLTPVRDTENLKTQIKLLRKMSMEDWYKLAKQPLKETLNLGIHEERNETVIEEILKYVSDMN